MFIQNRLTQHVSDIIMPIDRRTDCIKPRLVLAWMCWLRIVCSQDTSRVHCVNAGIRLLEYLHSHSGLNSCPDSTQPQPAHPG